MKRLFLLILIVVPLKGTAQNLQLHYDFGGGRKFLTATVEMFKPDTFGSTFWFIDFDFDFPGNPRSMSAAYWEISRDFYIPGLKGIHPFGQLGFHLEYNDGFAAFKDTTNYIGAVTYNNVLLAGLSFPVNIGNVSVATQLLCRMPRGMDKPDFQLTLVWSQYLLKSKLLFTGFMDLWSQDKIVEPDNKELVFQTEPQLWYRVTEKIAVGGEAEISRNFPVGPNEWEFMPTIGVRWEF
ncbi:MAG: DUF5020 family protein [Bacteroidales bacterium]|nr:DUF5020 family protein [Bacteroidales bacterium]